MHSIRKVSFYLGHLVRDVYSLTSKVYHIRECVSCVGLTNLSRRASSFKLVELQTRLLISPALINASPLHTVILTIVLHESGQGSILASNVGISGIEYLDIEVV